MADSGTHLALHCGHRRQHRNTDRHEVVPPQNKACFLYHWRAFYACRSNYISGIAACLNKKDREIPVFFNPF